MMVQVVLHKSTVDKWMTDTRNPAPTTVCYECKGLGLQRGAVYNCALRMFESDSELALLPEAALRSLDGGSFRDCLQRRLRNS